MVLLSLEELTEAFVSHLRSEDWSGGDILVAEWSGFRP